MRARDEHRRWSVTRLELQAWRNFSRQTEIHLGGRAFFIGPNASGKSNILDALRFLRDVAGDGLQGAVAVRGGMSEIRSLHTRRFPGVRIVRRAADLEDVATLIEQGLSPGEAIMPRAAARDTHQLSLSF